MKTTVKQLKNIIAEAVNDTLPRTREAFIEWSINLGFKIDPSKNADVTVLTFEENDLKVTIYDDGWGPYKRNYFLSSFSGGRKISESSSPLTIAKDISSLLTTQKFGQEGMRLICVSNAGSVVMFFNAKTKNITTIKNEASATVDGTPVFINDVITVVNDTPNFVWAEVNGVPAQFKKISRNHFSQIKKRAPVKQILDSQRAWIRLKFDVTFDAGTANVDSVDKDVQKIDAASLLAAVDGCVSVDKVLIHYDVHHIRGNDETISVSIGIVCRIDREFNVIGSSQKFLQMVVDNFSHNADVTLNFQMQDASK